MADALTALRKIQSGIETTPGTAVVATRLIPHEPNSGYVEGQSRKRLNEPRGVLGFVDDVLTRQMTSLELEQELDFEHSLLPLLCGIAGVDAVGTDAPYSYAMPIGLTSARALRSATFELQQSDGATGFIQRRMAYARPTSISVEFEQGGTAMIKSSWIGQAGQPLAALQAVGVAARRVIPAELFSVAIDDTWATLGTTRAGNVRSMGLEINTGITPAHHYSGRSDLDLDDWYYGRVDGKFSVVFDLDADAAAEVAHKRDGELRFLRLLATTGTGTGLREFGIDIAGRYISDPNLMGADSEQSIVELEVEFRADDVGGSQNMLEFNLMNALAAF